MKKWMGKRIDDGVDGEEWEMMKWMGRRSDKVDGEEEI